MSPVCRRKSLSSHPSKDWAQTADWRQGMENGENENREKKCRATFMNGCKMRQFHVTSEECRIFASRSALCTLLSGTDSGLSRVSPLLPSHLRVSARAAAGPFPISKHKRRRRVHAICSHANILHCHIMPCAIPIPFIAHAFAIPSFAPQPVALVQPPSHWPGRAQHCETVSPISAPWRRPRSRAPPPLPSP